MVRYCFVFSFFLIVASAPFAERPPQAEKTFRVLFENEDFAVVPLGEFGDPKLEDKSFSGLLVLRGYGGPVDYGDIWKFSGPHEKDDAYYWANSVRTGRLTAMGSGGYGFMVVSKSVKRLDRRIFDAKLEDAFVESVGDDLQSIAALIDRSEHGKAPDLRVQVRARTGLEDLSFKSQWISSNAQSGDSPSPLIDVIARTVDQSGSVVQHCTVWFVPLAWEDDKRHWKRFDQLSSPTSQSIPVGQYKMWANHNGRDGAKTPVSPGDDQKSTKNVDLDVP